ncbi:MAG: hypothetical protein ACREEY_11605, partial [Brevundimonas sp.]
RKRQYKVLPAGRSELQRWVAEGQSVLPIRDELMVRLRAEAVAGPTDLIETLEQLAAQHRQKLATYQTIEARDFPQAPNVKGQKLQHLVLKAGLAYENQRIAFCEEAIAILQAG